MIQGLGTAVCGAFPQPDHVLNECIFFILTKITQAAVIWQEETLFFLHWAGIFHLIYHSELAVLFSKVTVSYSELTLTASLEHRGDLAHNYKMV